MRPIPSVTTAEYILTPNAVIRRVQRGTQPAAWTLRILGADAATFDEHPAGAPALGVVGAGDDLAAEVARELAGDSSDSYRQAAAAAVDALIRFAQDISEVSVG